MCTIKHKTLRTGFIIFSLANILKYVTDVSFFLPDLLSGIGIGLILSSLLPESIYSKVKTWKQSWIK